MAARKTELRKLYDETANIYDRRYSEIQKSKYKLVLEKLPEKVGCILDLGCGTGLLLGALRERGRVVVGIDASEKMLEIAKSRAGGFLVLADAEHLPFKDEVFGCVVSVTLLQNIPLPESCMNEVVRALKRRGLAVFTTLKRVHSLEELKKWVGAASMEILESGEIPESEDVYCISRKN